ncbi:hypothetical protein [Serinibacter salmoneus]|uniref:Uncharacterized protein n=1 Tax=Serinibacter salmoneus TaxID=556530 RepID=A0A2A9D0Z5_9MICO|nr:hypothetical protein [Serinibacter salmoneus]PFG19935.1 hypothetical protein ATL40_1514 [Serinibacter salmoneus]
MTSSPDDATPATTPHAGCDHDHDAHAGHAHTGADPHADAPDPLGEAPERIAAARRRLWPRIALGVIGIGLGAVLGVNAGIGAAAGTVVGVLSALAWLIAAWGGILLASLARRGQYTTIALGQVLAAALAPAAGAGIALLGRALATTPIEVSAAGWPGRLAPIAVAAAAGWLLAGAVGEAVRLRALRSQLTRQDEVGLRSRAEAEQLETAALVRAERLALLLALAFGLAVGAMVLLPWLVLVLVPLAAAGAAWLGLRPLRESAGARQN